VVIEKGGKRVFASAVDWPGYARSGKTEAEALDNLAAYAPRYAKAVKAFSASTDGSRFTVVQRVAGGSGTDFGVPSSELRSDDEALTPADAKRFRAAVEAAWAAFDRSARAAQGKKLATGPRGGGRTVAKMAAHVLEAEVAYLSKLGSRAPKVEGPKRMRAVRDAVLDAFDARLKGRPVADPSKTARLWSLRYFARRSAWHALDHAWELEDRITR